MRVTHIILRSDLLKVLAVSAVVGVVCMAPAKAEPTVDETKYFIAETLTKTQKEKRARKSTTSDFRFTGTTLVRQSGSFEDSIDLLKVSEVEVRERADVVDPCRTEVEIEMVLRCDGACTGQANQEKIEKQDDAFSVSFCEMPAHRTSAKRVARAIQHLGKLNGVEIDLFDADEIGRAFDE